MSFDGNILRKTFLFLMIHGILFSNNPETELFHNKLHVLNN